MSAADLRDMLGPQAAGAATVLPAAAEILGPSPPDHGSVEIERRRAFDAVSALLRAWPPGIRCCSPSTTSSTPASRPSNCCISSADASGARLLIVATVRAENSAEIAAALEPVATALDVGPLDLAAVEQLARDAGQDALAADILQRTRGHTLFVVEVLSALRSGGDGVPQSLRGAVQARVRRTGPPVESLLRAASVLGARSTRSTSPPCSAWRPPPR